MGVSHHVNRKFVHPKQEIFQRTISTRQLVNKSRRALSTTTARVEVYNIVACPASSIEKPSGREGGVWLKCKTHRTHTVRHVPLLFKKKMVIVIF